MEILRRIICVNTRLLQKRLLHAGFLAALLALSGLGSGCQKFIDLNVKQEPEQWILYGTLRPEEILRVELYRTLPVIGVVSDSFWVSDASVWLKTEGADSVKLEEVGRGIYETAAPVTTGNAYALVAYHLRLPALSTKYLFLPPAPELSYTLRDSVSQVSANRYKSLLTLTFPDTLPSDVVYLNAQVEANQDIFPVQENVFDTAPLSASCYSAGRAIYVDMACTGSRTLVLDLPEYENNSGVTLPIEAFVIECGISSSSELDFFSALYQEEGFELGISDPIRLPQGITNGYGFWSVASGRVLRIER